MKQNPPKSNSQPTPSQQTPPRKQPPSRSPSTRTSTATASSVSTSSAAPAGRPCRRLRACAWVSRACWRRIPRMNGPRGIRSLWRVIRGGRGIFGFSRMMMRYDFLLVGAEWLSEGSSGGGGLRLGLSYLHLRWRCFELRESFWFFCSVIIIIVISFMAIFLELGRWI